MFLFAIVTPSFEFPRPIAGLVFENKNTKIEILFASATNDSKRAVLRAELVHITTVIALAVGLTLRVPEINKRTGKSSFSRFSLKRRFSYSAGFLYSAGFFTPAVFFTAPVFLTAARCLLFG